MKDGFVFIVLLIALSVIPFCSAPLVSWHFDEVASKVDLNSEDLITGNAVGDGGSFIAVLAPLLVIPFLIFILLFFSRFEGKIEDKDQEEIDDETDESVVSRFVVDKLLDGGEEDDIRRDLEMRGYDEAVVNKVFDELESEV